MPSSTSSLSPLLHTSSTSTSSGNSSMSDGHARTLVGVSLPNSPQNLANIEEKQPSLIVSMLYANPLVVVQRSAWDVATPLPTQTQAISPEADPQPQVRVLMANQVADREHELCPVLEAREERTQVLQALRNVGLDAEVRGVQATLPNLVDALRTSDLVILTAHGARTLLGEPQPDLPPNADLVLEDSNGSAVLVSPSRLISELSTSSSLAALPIGVQPRTPLVVFLAACFSENFGRALTEHFASLSSKTCNEPTFCISINNDSRVRNSVSRVFSGELASSLGKGRTVSEAFESALLQVEGIPALTAESRSRQRAKFVLHEPASHRASQVKLVVNRRVAGNARLSVRVSVPAPAPAAPRLFGRDNLLRHLVDLVVSPPVNAVALSSCSSGMGSTAIVVTAAEYLFERELVSNVEFVAIDGNGRASSAADVKWSNPQSQSNITLLIADAKPSRPDVASAMRYLAYRISSSATQNSFSDLQSHSTPSPSSSSTNVSDANRAFKMIVVCGDEVPNALLDVDPTHEALLSSSMEHNFNICVAPLIPLDEQNAIELFASVCWREIPIDAVREHVRACQGCPRRILSAAAKFISRPLHRTASSDASVSPRRLAAVLPSLSSRNLDSQLPPPAPLVVSTSAPAFGTFSFGGQNVNGNEILLGPMARLAVIASSGSPSVATSSASVVVGCGTRVAISDGTSSYSQAGGGGGGGTPPAPSPTPSLESLVTANFIETSSPSAVNLSTSNASPLDTLIQALQTGGWSSLTRSFREVFEDHLYTGRNVSSRRDLDDSDLSVFRRRLGDAPSVDAVRRFYQEWFAPTMLTLKRVEPMWTNRAVSGLMSREEAESSLLGKPPGSFLIRTSDSEPGKLVLSFVRQAGAHHVTHVLLDVRTSDGFVTLPYVNGERRSFPSLAHFVMESGVLTTLFPATVHKASVFAQHAQQSSSFSEGNKRAVR